MKRLLTFSLLLLLQLPLSISVRGQASTVVVSESLEIEALSPNLLLHVSYLETAQFGRVGCNGMVYINQNEALILDTPPSETQTEQLLDWLQKSYPGLRIKGVVVNHFHEDALGGLEVFHRKNIPSYGFALTQILAAKAGFPQPRHTFKKTIKLKVGDGQVIARYFGEAHTRDNTVCWIPQEKLLFGGCMLKAQGAGRGNLADANVAEWANTVEKVARTYPEVQVVVPGHGTKGGPELLMYTINMFAPDRDPGKKEQ